MTKEDFITSCKFKDITAQTIYVLATKKTLSAKLIMDKIENSKYYGVFSNGKIVILNVPHIPTNLEKTMISKITGLEVDDAGVYLKESGYWKEWIRCE